MCNSLSKFTKLVEACKKLEHIRQQLEDMTGQKNNLDLENKGLSSKVKELEDKLQVLKGVTDDNKRLQDKLGDLEVKIEEYEKLGMELTVLQKNHKGTTDLLNERVFHLLYEYVHYISDGHCMLIKIYL